MIDQNSNKNPFILRLIGLGRAYFVKTPWWLKKIYPDRVWDKYGTGKNIYLTFDDGPHPEITPFVLDELKKFNARASFFCIGQNAANRPEIYQRILDEGHRTGNHSQHHLNGWKTRDDIYLSDITEASKFIHSELFRPPYGKIKSSQVKKLATLLNKPKIIMWDVLSGDFDENCSAEACLKNVTLHSRPGSIIVFHDSEKAMAKLKIILPAVLKYFTEKGYSFRAV